MDLESWKPIDEFPGYAVSDHGRVMNIDTELIKIQSPNQQGIPSVGLNKDRVQYRRAVAPLVAQAFLDPPERNTFDTPINLDGDRLNNHITNLMWRPRWFAVKYHAQLRTPIAHNFHSPVALNDTGEFFASIRDAAVKYGLLEREIVLSALNQIRVFPTWQQFRVVD